MIWVSTYRAVVLENVVNGFTRGRLKAAVDSEPREYPSNMKKSCMTRLPRCAQ